MGWTVSYDTTQTKAEFIKERIRPQGGSNGSQFVCLSHSVHGNTLFAVWEITAVDGSKKRFIGIDLLCHRRGEGWGYKDCEESQGVYRYDCPLKFFDMVPCPGSYATEWREKVRAHHAAKAAKAKGRQKIAIGSNLVLIDGVKVGGCPVATVRVVFVAPRKIIAETPGGVRVKVAPRHIKEVVA